MLLAKALKRIKQWLGNVSKFACLTQRLCDSKNA